MLLRIINDILDFSKMEAGKICFETLDFDLRQTVESTIEVLADRADRKHVELVCSSMRMYRSNFGEIPDACVRY